MENPRPITLAHYWEKFTKEDREYLLSLFEGKQGLHMGKLPFINADDAYMAIYIRYPVTPSDCNTITRLLSILSNHNYGLITHKTQDTGWTVPKKYVR